MTIERLKFTSENAPVCRELEDLARIIDQNFQHWEALQVGLYKVAPELKDAGFEREIRVLEDGTGILGPSNSPSVRSNPHSPIKEPQRLSESGDIYYQLTPDEPPRVTEIIFYVPGRSPRKCSSRQF